ncbi:MAG: prolipoprotein diacylglyceryl transferase [Alsobacter sp.]
MSMLPMAMMSAPTMALTFPAIDPVLFSVGPLAIRWYALAYVAGLVLGWLYARRIAANAALWGGRVRPSVIDLDDLLVYAAAGVVIGGRLGYVLFYNPAFFLENPGEIIAVWRGGMAFHGGLAGCLVALSILARQRGLPVLSLADVASAAAPVGLFFGRIANFINGELWGRPTDVSWAFVFPHGGPLPRHPSQLYEAATEGLLLFLLLAWAIRLGALRRPGLICGLFGIGYGVARIGCEFFREPDPQLGFLIAGTTMGMLLSLPLVAAGAWLTLRSLRRPAVEPVRP